MVADNDDDDDDDDVIDLTSSTSNDNEEGEDTSATKTRRRKHTLTLTSSTITPDQPSKRVSRRMSARQKQRQLLKRRSEEGTGAKYFGKKKDTDDVNDSDVDVEEMDSTPIVYKKDEYFEVDEILDRRTRKYGSESAGVRHVVEYRKSVQFSFCMCWVNCISSWYNILIFTYL